MGRSKPKKKPVLVLAPEELEQAHMLFQQGAAEQLGEFDPVERAARSASLFGLAPMGSEDDEADNFSPLDPLDPLDDVVEEAEAPEPDKVLSLTRPRDRNADNAHSAENAMPFGALPKVPVKLPPLDTEPDLDSADDYEAPELAEDHDYSGVAPGFSTGEEGSEDSPVSDPVDDELARLVGLPDASDLPEEAQTDSVPDSAEAEAPAEDWVNDDWASDNWETESPGVEEAETEDPEAPELSELDPFDPSELPAENEISEPVDEALTPFEAELPEAEAAEAEAIEPAFEEAALPLDHEVASVTMFDDEGEHQPEAYVPPAEFTPQQGTQNALRAKLVREDVSLARPAPSLWRRIVAAIQRFYWRITFR